jgi:hypothetical protein
VLFVGLAIMLLSTAVSAEAVAPERRACLALQEELTAIFAAKDWPELDGRADAFVARCDGVTDNDFIANAMDWSAVSAIEQSKFQSALEKADACIRRFYAWSSCHVQRLIALIELGRIADARRHADTAVNLATHNIRITSDRLNRAVSELEREELDARLAKYELDLAYATFLRDERLKLED